jgi:site-specific DNA-methyltransferase (adenine-specific)
VLDPMMGWGTTLVAARKWGCRGTGVEIDRAYCALAQQRLEEAE